MKIGILISRSGPAGMWGPSSEAAAILAACEINREGGVCGAPLELVIADAGWTERAAAAAAADMLDLDGVDAVVGMHPSNTRAAIRERLGGRVPYYYTPQYEGGETGRATVAIGPTDSSLLAPTLPYFVERCGAKRFCFVANDYVWPQKAVDTATRILADMDGQVVGRLVVPFGDDHTATIQRIAALKPDVVVMFLLGSECVRFNRAFAAAGLAGRIRRLALAFDETVVYGIGAEASEGLHGVATFISQPRSAESARFLEAYNDLFAGEAAPISASGRSCYEGVHLAAAVAAAAGSAGGGATASFLAGVRRDRVRDLLPRHWGLAAPKPQLFEVQGLDLHVITTH